MEIARTMSNADSSMPNGASIAKDKLDTDYQSFLKLLIAQVSNQDPLEPMDSTTFVSQLCPSSFVAKYRIDLMNLSDLNICPTCFSFCFSSPSDRLLLPSLF